MLSAALRTSAARATPALCPSTCRNYAAMSGSSPHPIKDSGKELLGDAKANSNLLVFGGLALVGGAGLWWMTTDKPADPYPEHPKHQKGSEGLQKPLGSK
ncbi:hypothetical protein JCM11251_003763 [Rhodosporidiobolus azoricus]